MCGFPKRLRLPFIPTEQRMSSVYTLEDTLAIESIRHHHMMWIIYLVVAQIVFVPDLLTSLNDTADDLTNPVHL